jgi:hypothetical protein
MRYALALLLWLTPAALADRAQVGGRTDPITHLELQIDLPGSQHLKNKGGSDGAGLCVFASMDHAARWHRIKPLIGILERMRRYPGGGWPAKVDQVIAREYPGYRSYLQAEGDSVGIPLMDWAMQTGRLACVTYGYGERYGTRIAHMVNLVHLDSERACILDNNFPGEDAYEWMSRGEFLRRWRLGGAAWVYVFVEVPPPPIPVNRR